MRFLSLLLISLFATLPVHAQDDPAPPPTAPAPSESEKRAADLEAKLRQTLEGSEEGARILIELVDLYYDEGQVFGLVRAGKTFVNAQAGHPKHEEVMGKLIEGLAVASRNADLKAAILQFLERYPNSKKAPDFHRMLAGSSSGKGSGGRLRITIGLPGKRPEWPVSTTRCARFVSSRSCVPPVPRRRWEKWPCGSSISSRQTRPRPCSE